MILSITWKNIIKYNATHRRSKKKVIKTFYACVNPDLIKIIFVEWITTLKIKLILSLKYIILYTSYKY